MTAVVDPLDSTIVANGWVCPVCAVDVGREHLHCQVCLHSRPMDRHGVPQIFAGYRIHFNGVIPRTIKHPSHSVEWRMAERHGAVCYAHFDPTHVNLLLYRPGYERSDKVRRCVESDLNLPCVPITWMMDCLLQSRQIHPALYRLATIPAVAQPTTKGPHLPHHQHPYYLMNVDEYAIPTSFPASRRSERQAGLGAVPVDADGAIPPFFEVPPLRFTNVAVFDAVCDASGAGRRRANDAFNDDTYADARETRRHAANVEVLLCEQQLNKVDRMLFSGMRFLLSPTLLGHAQAVQAMEACGAKVVSALGESVSKLLRSAVTHVVYHNSDKKGDLMIEAAQAKRAFPGLALVQSNWAEDCMMMGELIPPSGMYVPTAKLMETLSKKFERR